MEDVFGNPIRAGDLCALSTRMGKHDSCIKIFYVSSIHEEGGPPFLRGFDGAGRLTQVQKAHNLVVVTGSIRQGNPRLRHILERLSEEARTELQKRLKPAGGGEPAEAPA